MRWFSLTPYSDNIRLYTSFLLLLRFVNTSEIQKILYIFIKLHTYIGNSKIRLSETLVEWQSRYHKQTFYMAVGSYPNKSRSFSFKFSTKNSTSCKTSHHLYELVWCFKRKLAVSFSSHFLIDRFDHLQSQNDTIPCLVKKHRCRCITLLSKTTEKSGK